MVGNAKVPEEKEASDGVSVVLATYNGARFLREQLASLSAQTMRPYELIVSDDGSRDDTVAILQAYARSAPFPVRLAARAVPLGYARNFLLACERAQGRWIAFCDQDDIWAPEKIEACRRALLENEAIACAHAVDLIDAEGTPIGRMNQAISAAHPPRRPTFLGPWHSYLGMSLVFQRDLLDMVDNGDVARGLDPDSGKLSLGHDKWIVFLAESIGRLALIREPLARYRIHGGNVSMSNDHIKIKAVQWSRMIGMPAFRGLGRIRAASHRSRILRTLAGRSTGAGVQGRLLAGAMRWKDIACFESLRLKFYGARGLGARLGLFATLIKIGGYRSGDAGGLGGLLLVKDLIIGVLRLRPVKV